MNYRRISWLWLGAFSISLFVTPRPAAASVAAEGTPHSSWEAPRSTHSCGTGAPRGSSSAPGHSMPTTVIGRPIEPNVIAATPRATTARGLPAIPHGRLSIGLPAAPPLSAGELSTSALRSGLPRSPSLLSGSGLPIGLSPALHSDGGLPLNPSPSSTDPGVSRLPRLPSLPLIGAEGVPPRRRRPGSSASRTRSGPSTGCVSGRRLLFREGSTPLEVQGDHGLTPYHPGIVARRKSPWYLRAHTLLRCRHPS